MIRSHKGNLGRDIPHCLPEELIEILADSGETRVERIVSNGHVTPPGFWYDQESSEFVLLVSGRARLDFDDGSAPLELEPGDWLVIPPRCRHRVVWTDPDLHTVWLAVHFR